MLTLERALELTFHYRDHNGFDNPGEIVVPPAQMLALNSTGDALETLRLFDMTLVADPRCPPDMIYVRHRKDA